MSRIDKLACVDGRGCQFFTSKLMRWLTVAPPGITFDHHNDKVVDIDGTCGQIVRQTMLRLLTSAALEVKLYVRN